MSYTKTHDLSITTGTYTNSAGEKKYRSENIGNILSDGEKRILVIKRTFNPAGVPNPDNKESVIVNVWPVKNKEEAKPKATQTAPDGDWEF